jgi:hypothetical protein
MQVTTDSGKVGENVINQWINSLLRKACPSKPTPKKLENVDYGSPDHGA